MTGLLTRADFRRVRDQLQLASMRERRPALEAQLWDKTAEVNQLLDELEAYPAPPSGIQYHLTRSQFDERMRIINAREKLLSELDVVQREWAAIDAEIGDIERDERYIQSKAQTMEARIAS